MSEEKTEIELLAELVKWTKVTSIPQVKQILLETLKKPEERLVYNLSNGLTSLELAEKAPVSDWTIRKWWEKWVRTGIADYFPSGRGKKAIASFSLEDFDIDIDEAEDSD